MKTLEYYVANETGYDRAACFAAKIYREKLNFHLTHFPEFLFAIEENEMVLGVIGLNRNIHNTLFTCDAPLMKTLATKASQMGHLGEQSILAIDGCSIGLGMLIATFGEYAYYTGIDGIVFAGIDVSLRTIAHLGFNTVILSPADRHVLPLDEQENYAKWFSLYTPIVAILPTCEAPNISMYELERHKKRIRLQGKFEKEILMHRARRDKSSTNSQ